MSDPLSLLANDDDDDDVEQITTKVESHSIESENEPDSALTTNPIVNERTEETLSEGINENPNKTDAVARPDSSLSDNSDLLAKIEEEMGTEPKDLVVDVDNPEKIIKTMESYIAFTVKTKTTRSDFEDPEYSVKRRYNDFLWLRQQLVERHPVLIIPPLPEKHSLTVDRFDKEFVKFRQLSLHRLMTRLSQHPVMSKDEILKAFLTLEHNDFQNYKKKGAGIISRVTKSLSTRGISLMLKNRSEEFTKLYDYSNCLGQKMGAFERISNRVVSEQNDYLLALSGHVSAFENWANVETDLSDSLTQISNLKSALHSDYEEMVAEMTLQTLLPAKEYILFSDSIKDALVRRDAIQHELEVITEELVKCTDEKQQLQSETPGAGGFLSRSNTEEAINAKTEKLSTRISELEDVHSKCKTKLEESNAQLKTDLERWHINKKADMKEMIGGMAARNVETYDKHINSLELALNHLKDNLKA